MEYELGEEEGEEEEQGEEEGEEETRFVYYVKSENVISQIFIFLAF